MIDNVTVKQRIEQFDLKHGPSVYDGHWIYFANGANRDGHPLGPLHEPPTDPIQRHRIIVKYYEVLLQQKVREFDNLKLHLKQHPGHNHQAEENLEQLRRLQRMVRHRQRQLQNAQEELKRHLPGYRTREEEAAHQRDQAASEADKQRYLNAVSGINI